MRKAERMPAEKETSPANEVEHEIGYRTRCRNTVAEGNHVK